MNSKIHHLKSPDADEQSPSFSTASSHCSQMTRDDLLVHADCVKCDECLAAIDVSCEYTIKRRSPVASPTKSRLTSTVDQEFILNCRSCALRSYQSASKIPASAGQGRRKVKKQYKHRLSSRQKEQLINELILNNVDLNVRRNPGENERLISSLAKEIRCSSKALLDYIHKHKLNKNSTSSIISSQQQLFLNKQALEAASQGKSISNMLEQLNKIDRILAPNRCPFDNDHNSADDDDALNPGAGSRHQHHLQQCPSLVRP